MEAKDVFLAIGVLAGIGLIAYLVRAEARAGIPTFVVEKV